jgi:hypothetical protein
MTRDLTKGVEAIACLSASAVRQEWERVHGAPAPAIAASLLARDLAWAMQAAMYGGLDRRIDRHLDKLCAASEDQLHKGVDPPATRLSAGAQLLREWGGKTHRVMLDGDGRYVYAGRSYRSLSAIAREITGARWSGPRFFGLPA